MDWLADIKKYDSDVDEDVVAKMTSTYRLVNSKNDAKWVSFGDPEELKRVKKNFLKKKLGLTISEEEMDKAITEVGEQMKDGTNNSRMAVYYLLAKKFGKLDQLR